MIILRMNLLKYENDVRALLMAFYHGVKIIVNPEADRKIDEEIMLEMGIDTCDSHLHVCVSDGERKLKDQCETDLSDYKQTKNDLKRLVYKVMCAYTNKTLPWGTLTGIRPTKIAMSLLEEHYTEEMMRSYFDQEYKISEEKYQLCTLVAKNEQRILKKLDYEKGFSLYTGIPFCPTICAYCSFSSFPVNVWKKKIEDYLEALFYEIEEVSKMLVNSGNVTLSEDGKKPRPLTFYMGGGTPTSLSADQMDRLLAKLFENFDLEHVDEKTIEAGRPDSITEDKLRVIRKYGISRISINPQTMNQKTLDLIGRKHTVEEVKSAFELARKCGFDNINMDLIAGLPGESIEDFRYTLSEIQKMAPESLTVHALAIKRAALVNREKMYLQSASVEEMNEMINEAFKTASQIGHEPYYLYRQKNIAGNLENVGYAKPGLEALYNILIMEEKQSIIALGAGASTKIVHHDENRIERIENVKSVKDYIERIDEMIQRKEKMFNA